MFKTNKRVIGVLVAFMVGMCGASFANDNQTLNGNNKNCIEVAKQIGEASDADTVAVLKQNNRVMVAIQTDTDTKELIAQCEEVLKAEFPRTNSFRIEVNNEITEKIIELSYYIGTDMDSVAVKGRFDFLWNI